MNWLTNFVKPKLSALVKRKDVPENLWQNCPKCGSMIHHKDLRENLNVCNSCNYHFRMSVEDRINLLFAKEDTCLLYTSPSPRDQRGSRMPSSA